MWRLRGEGERSLPHRGRARAGSYEVRPVAETPSPLRLAWRHLQVATRSLRSGPSPTHRPCNKLLFLAGFRAPSPRVDFRLALAAISDPGDVTFPGRPKERCTPRSRRLGTVTQGTADFTAVRPTFLENDGPPQQLSSLVAGLQYPTARAENPPASNFRSEAGSRFSAFRAAAP